jgi:hypothetical protein
MFSEFRSESVFCLSGVFMVQCLVIVVVV